MTKSASDKTGLPAWFLIVAAGGIVGIAAGGFLFFSGPQKKTENSAASTGAAAPAATAGQPAAGPASGTGPKAEPVSYDDWAAQITAANEESYPALMDGALRIKDRELRARVTEFLLVKWLNADTMTYLEYLDTLEGADDEGKDAWPVLVPAFVKVLPLLSEEAASSPDLEEAVLWMTDYYAEQNPSAALDWARRWLLGEAQEAALSTIAGQLSKTSLQQALAIAQELKTPNARIDAMANIGAELGAADPRKALEWAQSLQDPTERSAAIEEVMWAMSDADPVAAAAQIKEINNPELMENLGGSIAESLAENDPKAAIAWAEAIPAGTSQDEAVYGALYGWAAKDPKAALSYFQTKHPQNLDAAEGIFEQWAVNTPQDAAAQALQMTDPTLREHAIVGVVNGWLSAESPDEVEQWVDQLPAGRQRDLASATLVDALSVDDPQPAWDRALAIKDTQVREEALLSAFSGLAQLDPEAARATLTSPSLAETDRKLLQPLLDALAPPARN